MGCPPAHVFKPAGVPAKQLQTVVLSHEEYEAVRLADLEGLNQEEGAEKMGVSRATFGRILNSAHGVISEALVMGKALAIEGGDFLFEDPRFPGHFISGRCARRGPGKGRGYGRGHRGPGRFGGGR